MKTPLQFCLMVAAGLIAGNPSLAVPVTVFVPATGNPWLAGGDGSTTDFGDDVATEGPLEVSLLPGTTSMTFTDVTGLADNNASGLLVGPDGFAGASNFVRHLGGAANGIADVRAPLASLMGVFLADDMPEVANTPQGLDFLGAGSLGIEVPVGGGTAYPWLSPELFQPFFIGDGRTGSGTGDFQVLYVPDGATRLFLGIMDGFGWQGNRGGFDVTVEMVTEIVPTPTTLPLLAGGLLGTVTFLGWRRPRRGNA